MYKTKKGIVLQKNKDTSTKEDKNMTICLKLSTILPSPPRHTVEENIRRKNEKSFVCKVFTTFRIASPIYKQPCNRSLFADSTNRDNSVCSPEAPSHEELSVEFEAFV